MNLLTIACRSLTSLLEQLPPRSRISSRTREFLRENRHASRAQAGICVEPETPEALAEAILQLYKVPAYRKTLGQNGRQYVIEHYNRHEIALEFERLLLAVRGRIG